MEPSTHMTHRTVASLIGETRDLPISRIHFRSVSIVVLIRNVWNRIPMKTLAVLFAAVIALVASANHGHAQQMPFDRLPAEALDIVPPSERVSGAPGEMRIQPAACRTLPTNAWRRRIVDVAAQEWGFFRFGVVDETIDRPRGRRRRGRGNPEESARVAASIGGYWSVTPEGSWILENQNEAWNGPGGLGSRWRAPWSAAFISWVMCEGGLGDTDRFQRAVAHHIYIDQAIRARDTGTSQSAFVAYDVGEIGIYPGDLLCTARRPGYRNIAERWQQMGEGARTHCDVVVKVDEANEEILAIGGNVRGTVSLKRLPATRGQGEILRPTRTTFAHLKLRSDPIALDALDNSPTIKALGCDGGFEAPTQLAAMNLSVADNRC